MTISKQALIIAVADEKDSANYLPGAEKDIHNYENFLISDAGGRWYYKTEVKSLLNPTKSQVLKAISEVNDDYSFIAYSGHGYISSHNGKTYMEFKDGELSESDLITKSKKQTLLLDTCRKIVRKDFVQSIKKAMDESAETVYGARDIFDKHISRCEEGIIKIYSTSPNQSAGEDLSGGYFTSSIISAGKEWNDTNGKNLESNVLDLKHAFENAVIIMKMKFDTTQVPQINGGRRYGWFPFAVRNVIING